MLLYSDTSLDVLYLSGREILRLHVPFSATGRSRKLSTQTAL